MGKGIVIANAVVVIGPTSKMLQNFPFSAVVFSESQHTFLMYSLSLFFDTTACEQSFHEEITYPFSCLYKFIIGNLELIICFIIWCVCIIVTRVQSNELWVLIEFGEFSWAHKQHVLQKMGDSQWSLTIAETAYIHWDGTSCFLRFRILNEDYFELIG